MNVHLKFEGMATLYRTCNNRHEVDWEFQGTTIANLIGALIIEYGTPMGNALLNVNGELDNEIRVTLNDDCLLENRMTVTLNDGDAVAFSVIG